MLKDLDIFNESGWSQLLCHKHLIQRDLILNNTILIEVLSKNNPASIGDTIVIYKTDLKKFKTTHFFSKILSFENGKILY
jgi:hypothetical protein